MVWDLASATWVRTLTDERLEEALDLGTFQRGVGYADREMVTQIATLNRGRVVVAKVKGSGAQSYQTIISQHSDPKDDVLEWSARCSCPVATDCKHAVAVILTVRDALGGDEPAVSSWEQALSPFAAEQPAERLEQGGSPMALIVEIVLDSRGVWNQPPEPRVRLRPTRRTKAGGWAKKYGWSEVRGHGWSSATVLESHRQVLDELAKLHDLRSGGGYRYSYGTAMTCYLDDFGADVWPALRRIHDAGVALIDGESHEPIELDDSPAEMVLDVTRAGGGLLLRPVVEGLAGGSDDEDQIEEIHLVGDPSHGLVITREDGSLTLASLTSPLAADVAALVGLQRAVEVPEADVDRFLALYLTRLRRRLPVISSDHSVDLPESVAPRLHVHVRAAGHGIRLDLGFVYAAGAQSHVVGAAAAGAVPRDHAAERALVREIEALTAIPGAISGDRAGHRWMLQPSVSLRGPHAIHVLTQVVPLLDDDPRVVVELDDDLPTYEELVDEPQIAIGAGDTSGGSDWLDLHVSVTIGDVEIPFEPLFEALVRGDELMHLETGEWFRLDHPVLTDLRALIAEARELAEPEAGHLRLSRYQADLWDELSDLGDIAVDREHAWRASVETLREIDTLPAPSVPTSLGATLRPYQLEGYHWLTTLWDAGLGGVLADDMGLGKTVQALALLARAHEAGDLDRPVLVVAPTSVVGTWASEAAKFVPDLEVCTLGSTHKRRGSSVVEAVEGAQLVVTSYAVLRIDAEQFTEVEWRGVILDEAQFVKNDRSKIHQALRGLSAPFVLAVTGTPLENSLMDLWSLFALAAPGLYPRRDQFNDLYRKPIESGAQPELLDRLRRRIRPLMLRRTKEQVALDLPPKQVQVLPVDLTPTHRRVYDRHLQRERKRVLGLLEDPDGNRVAILASLTRLRQLSLDPGLVDEELLGQGASAKIDVLVEHLRELAVEGHRALVFSQFTGFLGLVRDRLDAEGITTSYLDGSTTNRPEVIDGFKQGEQTAFLISLKAGGVGLTLTEADYVFILDPWWNPAAEAQAIDRVHRIGQDRPVMVYRLVSTGTIEEKVLALQERKRDLFERVVDEGGALSGAITSTDIRALLDPGD
ncbi:MAG: DEAD/DEAH box helicase [Janibacter sp.]|nr:DEAD/DEAH box helicase [Janibacter sp.]